MELIQLTAISISVLTQAILLVLCIVYLIQQRQLRTPGWIVIWFAVAALIYTVTIFSVISLRNYNPIRALLLPLQYVPISLAVIALIQFAYRFPINNDQNKFERNIALLISSIVALLITGFSLLEPLKINMLELQLMAAVCFIGFFWSILVAIRSYMTHLGQSGQYLPQSLFQPASHLTRAFNSFIFILLVPIFIVTLMSLARTEQISHLYSDFALSFGSLIFIYFFVILFLNFSWQRTRFIAQLLSSIIMTQLILISLAALILAPRLSRTYTNDELLPPESNLQFVPQEIGFRVDSSGLTYNEDLGEKISLRDEGSSVVPLNFNFPYFDQSIESIYVSDNRIITFDEPFSYMAMRDGLQAGIAALAMDIDPESRFINPASGVYVNSMDESVMITWLDLPLKTDEQPSTAQVTLHEDGVVDMVFISHPTESVYSPNALGAPWLIGLHNGQLNTAPHEVDFLELPFSTEDGRGIVQDYHADFRSFLNTNIQPLIIILLISLTVTLAGFPLFMGINVLRPIDALVHAVEEVNQGNLDINLRVRRNDEIGFLTDAFNRMVRSLRDQNIQISEYSNNLEKRVIQRTAMLAKMTEQAEKSKEEAIMANQTKSAFIANVTHEIRTPLNAIVGFSDILREDVQEVGQLDWVNDIDRIKNSANELLAMINDILDISKIEAGRTTFLYEDFNLRNIVIDIVDLLRPLFGQNNNQVTFNSRVDEPVMQGDYMKVRQIIQNLIGNAAKFTENGLIHIVIDRITERNRIFYLIQVRDTGIGMSDEQIERVFEPFQQADNSTTRNYGGSGLGLAISKQYAEMMGGRLWAKSKPEVGSTFFLVIPVKPPSSAEVAMRIKENEQLLV